MDLMMSSCGEAPELCLLRAAQATMPPAAVLLTARCRVAQGLIRVHSFMSLPVLATQLRSLSAWAGRVASIRMNSGAGAANRGAIFCMFPSKVSGTLPLDHDAGRCAVA